jgi:hypothetical protein
MNDERRIQNEIRNALADHGLFFRANVGRAWTGDEVVRLNARELLIRNPRPFDTGLPAGFSDLFGLVPIDTEDGRVAQFTAIECKAERGRIRDAQQRFLQAVEMNGGRAGIARSVEDALRIVGAR